MGKSIVNFVILLFSLFFPSVVIAEGYKASIAEMPVHAISETEGIQIDLVRAIEKVVGQHISIGVFPFARSMRNVIQGEADFHTPLIKNDITAEAALPYYYSTETIYDVNFVLYTLKGSDVSVENLSRYKIETDRAHVDYFPFRVTPSDKIESSLRRLSAGRIDGYIFADTPTDRVLRSIGLKNIQRQLYRTFDVKIILPKTERGRQVDKLLSEAIRKLKASGQMQKIVGPVDQPYDNWQP